MSSRWSSHLSLHSSLHSPRQLRLQIRKDYQRKRIGHKLSNHNQARKTQYCRVAPMGKGKRKSKSTEAGNGRSVSYPSATFQARAANPFFVLTPEYQATAHLQDHSRDTNWGVHFHGGPYVVRGATPRDFVKEPFRNADEIVKSSFSSPDKTTSSAEALDVRRSSAPQNYGVQDVKPSPLADVESERSYNIAPKSPSTPRAKTRPVSTAPAERQLSDNGPIQHPSAQAIKEEAAFQEATLTLGRVRVGSDNAVSRDGGPYGKLPEKNEKEPRTTEVRLTEKDDLRRGNDKRVVSTVSSANDFITHAHIASGDIAVAKRMTWQLNAFSSSTPVNPPGFFRPNLPPKPESNIGVSETLSFAKGVASSVLPNPTLDLCVPKIIEPDSDVVTSSPLTSQDTVPSAHIASPGESLTAQRSRRLTRSDPPRRTTINAARTPSHAQANGSPRIHSRRYIPGSEATNAITPPRNAPFRAISGAWQYQEYRQDSLVVGSSMAQPYTDNSLRRKKSLNVDSPAFTPGTLPVPSKTSAISSQAAAAAPFTPRGLVSGTATPTTQPEAAPIALNPAQIREFTPQYDTTQNIATNGTGADPQTQYDPFIMQNLNQAMASTPYNNPYADEINIASNGAGYFQSHAAFAAPTQVLNFHLYAPIGPHKEDILAYQRHSHDFFIPNDLREELTNKSEATHRVQPNSPLPIMVGDGREDYHTLFALDTGRKSHLIFGYPNWVYKAVSSKTGNTYVLLRLQGFRLSSEKAIKSVQDWKRVDNGNVVSVIDAFTTRAFNDSSLIFVYNYHPLAKTLLDHHSPTLTTSRFNSRNTVTSVPEPVLWGYIVQVASAIKAVHAAKLAVRCMDLSKILLTEKNRIRLSACSVLDVVHYDQNRSIPELQQEDFRLFGRLILAIASNNLGLAVSDVSEVSLQGALDNVGRTYSPEFHGTIQWLLSATSDQETYNITIFLRGISTRVMDFYDSSLHANDSLTANLGRELENGRLFRLVCKLGAINERPDFGNERDWSESGHNYMLKLFRDYVFHQVDANGRPVVNLGHMIECLNKLDAGSDQRIALVSRDEDNRFIVSYKDLKKFINQSFQELGKSSTGGTGGTPTNRGAY